ncbi:LEA type 2 family protein [Streptomyces coelicoflavus]|uniref:LEA type 2 family protein n=1 Tax=Streptomyces coelicoflavus TaxID=285562 RepID=UPI0021099903|nr:LEA type 2 family protein [Streptomyces coelicoflavus]MCQ4201785.1 LEA type 2 family protein [Streptomyces coelicoflavus]
MTTRGRALRYTAISALVVLSLTGFSTGRHGHGHGGDGGGGCSSSSQDHDSSSSTSGGGDAYKDDDDTYGSGGSGYHDYDDDTYGDGTGGGDTHAMSATLELIACATETEPYATVEVTNPNDSEYTFPVTVRFIDVYGTELSAGHEEATVPAGGVTEVRIPFDGYEPPYECQLEETVTSPS